MDGGEFLCTLQGFGFSIASKNDSSEHVVNSVEDGSPAEQAGLKYGDLVLAVNGRSTKFVSHEEVRSTAHFRVSSAFDNIVIKFGKNTCILIVSHEEVRRADQRGRISIRILSDQYEQLHVKVKAASRTS